MGLSEASSLYRGVPDGEANAAPPLMLGLCACAPLAAAAAAAFDAAVGEVTEPARSTGEFEGPGASVRDSGLLGVPGAPCTVIEAP